MTKTHLTIMPPIASRSSQDTRAPLATFLCLTFGLSALWYTLIIRAGSLGGHGGVYVFALMWSPGTSALITRLIFQHVQQQHPAIAAEGAFARQ